MILKKWFYGLPLSLYFLLLILFLQLLPGWLLSLSRAQAPPGAGLTVGQAVPDLTLPEVVNYQAPGARLSDFRGKLLLIDFWATWCGNCKAALPKLDAIQQEFDGKVQVLLVNSASTRDTPAKVEAYFDRWRRPDGSRYQLPSVVNDTVLDKLFPHRLIPHLVWIGPDGQIMAFTSADQVTPENVRQVLRDGKPLLPQKNDVDLSRPLFSTRELPAGNLLHYGILLKGRLEGLPSGTRLRRQGNTVIGAALTNTPLLTMYRIAARALYPQLGDKGLVLAVTDSSGLLPEASSQSETAWKARYLYSYDLVIPPGQSEELFRYMLEDLNHYSGYRASLEPRRQNCLVLRRKGRQDKLQSQGGTPENKLFQDQGPYLQNLPLGLLVARLNSSQLPYLVVDESGYTGNVDIRLQADLDDLPALRRELQRYGLELVEARRTVPVLVLREDPPTVPVN